MTREPEFLEYGEALDAPPDEVGGKARNLARLHREGLDVPDGVALPRAVCAAFDGQGPPEALFRSISERLAGAAMLVVRSSSPQEDAPRRSWAGQFASVVCRNEPAAIREACLTCWSSLASAAVQAYARATGETERPAHRGMALLIQRLVPASAAGVCFTPGPEANRQAHLVNAVHGLGSALTDDEVFADHYTVEAESGAVSRNSCGRQTKWRPPDDPLALRALPEQLAGRPALDPEQAARVARLSRQASHVLGCRADTEWALGGDTLYLVQARPVTAEAGQANYISWTRDNAADVIPGAVTPLTWSFLEPAVNGGFRQALRSLHAGGPARALFALIDNRVWFNMTAYAALTGGPRRATAKISLGAGYLYSLLRHKLAAGRAESQFPRRLEAVRSMEPRAALTGLQQLMMRYMSIHIRTTVLMDIGLLLLRHLLRKRTGEDDANRLTDLLLGGTGQLASCASADAVRELAAAVGRDPLLSRRVIDAEPEEVSRLLVEGGPEIREQWQDFLERHGHGALEEFELLRPRWREEPHFVGRALQAWLERGEAEVPEAPGSEGRQRLKRLFPLPLRRPVLFLAAHLQRCSLLRESCKQLLVRVVDAAREQALRLAGERGLDPPQRIFFMTMEEALAGGGGPADKMVDRRRQDWERAGEIVPPAEIREYVDGRLARIPRQESHGPVLHGMALSSGHHTGIARVILDPDRAGGFSGGDVLVARATNPGWSPLIALAGAVVTDMGNYLSHGAIIARELGIPAVGNLYDATTRIGDGQLVEVDGDLGLVRLVGDEQ